MSQLTKRVVLVHELGQLGRSEELFDSCGNRLDVDQGLRGNVILILGGHTLTNDSLQSGKTDAVLVLKQLTYGTDTTVTQMVDIVVISDAVLQMISSFVICFGISSWMLSWMASLMESRSSFSSRIFSRTG